MVFYNDGLTLYTKTNIHSAKVKIKDNPAAYVLLGYNDTTNRSFVEMEATIEIVTEQEVDWLWETQDKSFSVQKTQSYVF